MEVEAPVAAAVVEPVAAAPLTIEDSVRDVLRRSMISNGLLRGARECIKALDCSRALVCFMPTDCSEKPLVSLVEALCKQNNIPLVTMGTRQQIGEWVGQCKLDRDGNPRKVVSCSVVVVQNYGEVSSSHDLLKHHISASE